MRKQISLAALVLAFFAGTATTSAQTTVTARTGTDSQTYRFSEVIHQAKNGVLTGVGYNDAGDVRDYTNTGGLQNTYGGAGYAFNVGGTQVQAIGFVNQANGDGPADSQTTISPWILATRRVGPIVGTANYFSFVPVGDDGSQPVVHVLEQAKAEYALTPNWLAGAGYSGSKAGEDGWAHRPFVTVTRKTPIGNFEVWAQRPAEGQSAFQLRYGRSF